MRHSKEELERKIVEAVELYQPHLSPKGRLISLGGYTCQQVISKLWLNMEPSRLGQLLKRHLLNNLVDEIEPTVQDLNSSETEKECNVWDDEDGND